MLKAFLKNRTFTLLFWAAVISQNFQVFAESNSTHGKYWIICADERYARLIWSVNKIKAANPRMIPVVNRPAEAVRLLDVSAVVYEGNNILDTDILKGMPSYDLALSSPMQYVVESCEALGSEMKQGSHSEIGMALPLYSANLNKIHALLLNPDATVLVIRSSHGDKLDLLRRLTNGIFDRMLSFKAVTELPKHQQQILAYDDKQITALWKNSILPGINVHPREVTVYPKLGIIAVALNDDDVNLGGLFASLLSEGW